MASIWTLGLRCSSRLFRLRIATRASTLLPFIISHTSILTAKSSLAFGSSSEVALSNTIRLAL